MLWAFLISLLVSGAAIVGSTSILLLGRRAERAAVWILPFAVGTLIAGSALHLIPEALERRPADEVMLLVVAGIVAFIALERALRWRHTHEGDEHTHADATARMILWGDALHNFVDGLVLGATFSVDPRLGLIAALAIFAHEVPQEIGDFAVLLASGMPRRRALVLNYLSAMSVVAGALVSRLWTGFSSTAIGWLLPLAAGGFLYIALADLVPSLHHRRGRWAAVGQIGLILLGIATIRLTGSLLPEH